MNNELVGGNTSSAVVAQQPSIIGTALFVDDEDNILTSLRRLMRKQPVGCFFASSAKDGLEILEKEHIDIIISDMRMPNMDGAEFLGICKKKWPKTVRILLTGHSDINSTIKALNHGGIFRYLTKPWDDEEIVGAITQGLRITQLEKEKIELLKITQQQNQQLSKFNEDLESRVKSRTDEIKQTSDMLELVYQQLKDSYGHFVKLFSSVISSRKYLEKSQSKKVSELVQKLSQALKLPDDEVLNIYFAALLMDLGKLNLADSILQVPEENLTSEQLAQFEKHPLFAEMTLASMPDLDAIGKIIRDHMEAIDGSGFPNKLKNSAISRGARILRVARDFVGLQSGLIRDVCLDSAAAYKIIKAQAGKIYDPYVVKALEHLSIEFDLGEALSHEIKVEALHLTAGLVVSRDIHNSMGILMIAKDFKLTSAVIDKLVSISSIPGKSLKIFVYKEVENKK
jgi:response regulator RpfG family c-di-GMP phosphodiesterase